MKTTKLRITMFVDKDVLKHFKKEASKTGEKYQTLINRALRDSVFRKSDVEGRLKAIEAMLSGLKKPKK
jgi:BrnA antitoxin of type II toxin-antitoxin system